MKKEDGKKFAERMNGLNQILNGKDLTDPMLMIYFKALEKYDINVVIGAISKAAVSFKFFPKPVELIELLEGIPEDKAEIQCNIVFEQIGRTGPYQSICFDDPVTMAVIKQHFGGWVRMCEEMIEDKNNFAKKDFIKAYVAFSRSGIKHNGYLPGISERDNSALGINKKHEIKMIGCEKKCNMLLEEHNKNKKLIGV